MYGRIVETLQRLPVDSVLAESKAMARIIATISGGKSSGYMAHWALQHYPKSDVVLYFNDTGWEHPDLHRFLRDLSVFLDHPITEDSDGRDVELLAYDKHAIPNNRMPFCSVKLKAERLQKYCRDGDVLLFGIGAEEAHRAVRIVDVYAEVARRRRITLTVRFPLIEQRVTPQTIDAFYVDHGIEIPALYRLGFKHNNCGGGVSGRRNASGCIYFARNQKHSQSENGLRARSVTTSVNA